MPNHIHFILEVKNGSDLGKIMQGLNQTYTIWFNEKYKKVGHLWQGRYKSMVIQKNKYMLDCLEYVELNPLRANLVRTPSEYPWSSWQARVGYNDNNLLDMPTLT
jgi:putative transposase